MTIRLLIISLIFSLLLPPVSFAEDTATTADQTFLNARTAAQKDEWTLFTALKDQLPNYPLLPYLEYYQLDENFKTANDTTIKEFLTKYANTPLANRLRTKWLIRLAAEQNWPQFLAVYQPTSNINLQCNYLNALQQSGKVYEADAQIPALWATGASQPNDCDSVFANWLKTKTNKDDLLWQRFELALKSYNFGLANHLSSQMSESKKSEALAIIKLYSNPALVNNTAFQKQYPSSEVISFGIARIAYKDPIVAIQTWNRLKNKFAFTHAQQQRIFQAIALKLALRKNNLSLIWFEKIIHNKLDPVYEDWLIHAALYHNDWKLVKTRIQAMPAAQRESPKWQYWYARALEQLGDKYAAEEVYEKVAQNFGYYGFLAMHHVHHAIKLKNTTPYVTANEIAAVKQMPAFQRAALLYHLKLEYDAWMELYYLINQVSPRQQYIITKLVSDWRWYPETLLLSNETDYKEDLILRFPMLYENTVIYNANLRKLNPALVYAIIRQESYFGYDSVSPAGAIGLMQLMPGTALRTSKQFQLKYSRNDLVNPEFNIAFGCAHLRKALGNFAGNPVLAIAAYNAGPEAVKRWLPTGKTIPADIWIETIPFHETRNYIKNVISNYIVYQHLLGQEPDLASIMPAINYK